MVFICVRCYKRFDSVPHMKVHFDQTRICKRKVESIFTKDEEFKISSISRINEKDIDNNMIYHKILLENPTSINDFEMKYDKYKCIFLYYIKKSKKEEHKQEENDDNMLLSEKDDFICMYCYKHFKDKSNMRRHIKGNCIYYQYKDELEILSNDITIEGVMNEMLSFNPKIIYNTRFIRNGKE